MPDRLSDGRIHVGSACRQEATELRRAEAKLARAAAALAITEQVADKQSASRVQRTEAAELEKALWRDVMRRRAAAAAQRRLVAAERARMHAAVAAVREARGIGADSIRKEVRAGARKVAAELEKEHKKRRDLIRQLQAVERVPQQRVTAFDRTTCSSHGLLEEMSIQACSAHPGVPSPALIMTG
jgi:hypothetical protein